MTLYVVATPIGNLADITYRAVKVLDSVDYILCEDTRNTKILLEKYNINTPLESYHKFCEKKKTEKIITDLKEGKNIALVSDAGTPLISDPGEVLIEALLSEDEKIVPIGGICAVTTLLSATKRKDEDFKFIGFLPRTQKQTEDILIKNSGENLVFYESPKRIKETLSIIYSTRPNAEITLARELTKKFEEIKTGKIKDIISYYSNNPIKGEIAVLLHKEEKTVDENLLKDKINKLNLEGFSTKDISKILQITDNVPKNKIKNLLLKD